MGTQPQREVARPRLYPVFILFHCSISCHVTRHGYEIYQPYAFLLACTDRQALRTTFFFYLLRDSKTFLSLKEASTRVPVAAELPFFFLGFILEILRCLQSR
ncbi:hypothetical protein PGIGA_G00043310 [Pangasianodon gigas]|uniref:Uncharacterized protein n=1 Tax=Pangasianodon gigas TaxID=30993 RepID=A0ACC5X123_PANGG|nr:hypothetical protein [Pangasianodon gigas]